MDLTDIQRAQGGDRQAMARVLEQIAPLVQRFGLRMCRHEADAEDVLQDTLLSVIKHLGEYAGRASLSSWVFTLARTACIRKRRGRKNQPHVGAEALETTASSALSPERESEEQELRRALDAALGALSDDHREVLLLRDMEGLSAPEVAAALGIGVRAVKSRLHRARRALQEGVQNALGMAEGALSPECPDTLRAFSQKLEGELVAEDCAAMERHVAACSRCAARCATLRSALGACRAQAEAGVSAEVQAHIRSVVHGLLTPTAAPSEPTSAA